MKQQAMHLSGVLVRLPLLLCAALLCSSLAMACGDGDDDVPDMAQSGGTIGDGDGDGDGAVGDGDGGIYVFTTQQFGAGGEAVSYVITTDTLDLEALSLDEATEIAGRALGTGPHLGGALFVGTGDEPTLTRYEVSEEGTLRDAGESVSFLGEGVTGIAEYGAQLQYVAEDKAYYFDGGSGQVLVWNPRDMTVETAMALEALDPGDAILSFSEAPVRLEDKIVLFAGLRTMTQVPSLAAAVVVDTETDDVTVVTDDRCGYVRTGALGNDGLIYMATEAYGASVHRLNNDNAAPPCMLRFDPELLEFDADFYVELASLFDEDATAASLMAGPDGGAFLRVLDEEAAQITEETSPRFLASASAWTWVRITLGDEPAIEEDLAADPTGGSVVPLVFGERIVAPVFTGTESTTLVELTEDGPAADPLATIPGLVFSGFQAH